MTRRVAALDCGTNSLRLLVADVVVDPGRPDRPRLLDVHRRMAVVRLGEDVDRTGRLSVAALARTETALREFAALIGDADADSVRMVATSAVRDAANREDFQAMVRRVLGVPAEVLSGPAEAVLSFAGAVHGLPATSSPSTSSPPSPSPSSPTGPVVVLDIGGGSTELVRGDRDMMTVDVSRSFDVGSVRLTERHIRHDPPTPQEIAAIEADVLAAWRAGASPAFTAQEMIGVAGTVTTVAGLALGLAEYDSSRIHGAVLTGAEVDRTVTALIAMDRAERSACRVIHPGRVDVIAAGGMIMRTVLHQLEAERVRVSEHDILDGVALSLLHADGYGAKEGSGSARAS